MANLILPSLEIQNFRAFEHLRIERLGRVNLITGKNNVGKTSLLEALYLYARGNASYIRELLSLRDEIRTPIASSVSAKNEELENQISNVKHLFHGRKQLEDISQPIRIGPINGEKILIGVTRNPLHDVYNYGKEAYDRVSPQDLAKSFVLSDNNHLYIVLRTTTNTWSFITGEDFVEQNSGLRSGVSGKLNCQFLRASGGKTSSQSRLWDKIALTLEEEDLLNALRIILPNIQRVGFIGEEGEGQGRTPIVREVGVNEPLPLRSLGEGMNRLFGIALALTAARDGILLVDELEIGLHYSVMPDVWKLIFQVAERLNVQVFATTHSWDCIEAFQKAASHDENEEALLIRLSEKNGKVRATIFDEEDLAIVTRDQIEVR